MNQNRLPEFSDPTADIMRSSPALMQIELLEQIVDLLTEIRDELKNR